MGRRNRTAANQLLASAQWRSCVSRAYYAAYCEVTHALLAVRVSMPAGRTNPKHATLPALIGNNLMSVRSRARWRLSGAVKKLYDLRIIADYLPAVDVGQSEARIAMGLMDQTFLCLNGAR